MSRFEELCLIATAARDRGDYGIAACLVIRVGSHEVVCFGQNTLFTEADPAGHAEMNALRVARELGRGAMASPHVTVRSARDHPGCTTLYATVEPCPMCTVAALNAKPDRIVVAVADPCSGSLHPDRLSRLPVVWQQLARSIDIAFCQSDRAGDASNYLPPGLLLRLQTVSLEQRARLDERLRRGLLDWSRLATSAT